MADTSFAQQVFCTLRYSATNRSNASSIAKEFSTMFDVDIELVRTIQTIDIDIDILNEAATDLPEPEFDPLICQKNRHEFVNNIIALSEIYTH